MPERLNSFWAECPRIAIAFSGGVDSALLAYLARRALGDDNVLLLHAASVLLPECDRAFTAQFAEAGYRIRTVTVDPMALDAVRCNRKDRCYHCKKLIFGTLQKIAAEAGFPVLADGTNADDPGDYRPGLQAAAELGVRHTFFECGIGKNAIRTMAQTAALPNWDLPASACLASRIPTGMPLEESLLRRIDGAEKALKEHGFAGVRVRVPGDWVKLEMDPALFPRLLMLRGEMLDLLRQWGFDEVTLDLRGYRTGSMNRQR
ncbi:MAG: ATP-dependent sacrificial sulfur transferase LarE [Lentisphaeria bacterium]|nr:ATP-dependent sacrificial sulfur transferase LarE [Lentisphaeria bacterium]